MAQLPDSEPLLTLLALHEAGSESAAAELLGIGQSSVSRRISTLQRLTGEPLTVRTATGTKLTEFGERLLPFAREARAALTGAARWLSGEGSAAGPLRLGLDADLAARYAGRLAGLAGSEVTPVLSEGWSRELVERVRDGALDAAVVLWAPAGSEPGFTAAALTDESLVLIAAAGVRLASAGEVDAAALRTQTLLMPPAESEVTGRGRALLRAQGLEPAMFVELGSPGAVREAVVAGAGVGVGLVGSYAPEVAAGWLTSAPLGPAAALTARLVVSDGLPPAVKALVRSALGLPTAGEESSSPGASSPAASSLPTDWGEHERRG
ncbi:MAG TPA: LysR family transcriptional regulator [Trueperaceae bacterium]